MMQAKCAISFFAQGSDGVGRGYMLDREMIKASGKVGFMQTDESDCIFDEAKRADSCTSLSWFKGIEYPNAYYDYIMPELGGGIIFFSFGNKPDLDAFLASTDKSLPNAKFPSASKMYLHRCIGFGPESIAPHLTGLRNNLEVEDTLNMMFNDPPLEELPLILDVMQDISAEAHNATLPGQ